ncbi:hypothetical protein HBB16_10485 [Pseudonocardia sp. MCCB 268]|nr:hypothetical protein [Pseudonocardia cytotoxica]
MIDDELVELRRQAFEGRYDYEIEPGRYTVADHSAVAGGPGGRGRGRTPPGA